MPYSKINYQNNSTPAINATNLNKMDNQIYQNTVGVEQAQSDIEDLNTTTSNLNTNVTSLNSNVDILFRDVLKVKLRQTGLNLDPNAWSDTIDDATGLDNTKSGNYYFDTTAKSFKFINNATMLMPLNGTEGLQSFTDLKGHGITGNGGVSITTAESKVGGSCASFDGSTGYLTFTDHVDFEPGTGDFTIDFWFKPNVTTGVTQDLFHQDASIRIVLTSGGYIQTYYFTASSTSYVLNTPAITVSQWHHYALVRKGGTIYHFLDGVLASTSTDVASSAIYNPTGAFYIGRLASVASNYFNGYMNNFRFVKGTALWTSNFTPPVFPFDVNKATLTWNTQTSSGTISKAIVETIQNTNTGTLTYNFSRDGGTTNTPITPDTITDISTQPNGTSVSLKAEITGNAELLAIAWGGEI